MGNNYLIRTQMTTAQFAVCTAKTDCKAAGSCCSVFAPASAGTNGTVKVCFNAGSAVGSYAIPVAGTVTTAMLDANKKGWLTTACPAAAAGASTLAVSAAAVATAVYMM